MDNKQKALIAVLVAVVILFVVAVAFKPGSGEGDANDASSDRGGFFDLFGSDPAAVPADQLGGCDRSGVTITVSGSCDLTVGPSEDRMRLVKLRTNKDIDISAPAPEDADLEIEKELEAGKEVAIAVDSGGIEIDLDCGFGQTCTLVVLGGDS